MVSPSHTSMPRKRPGVSGKTSVLLPPEDLDADMGAVCSCPGPSAHESCLYWVSLRNHSSHPAHSPGASLEYSMYGWLRKEGRSCVCPVGGLEISVAQEPREWAVFSKLHFPQGSLICFHFLGKENSKISKLQTTCCWQHVWITCLLLRNISLTTL